MADALGFSFREGADPEQQLLNYLREKELLLVLDGMERILKGATLLAKILRRGPGVILLVTSQERLNLREEWVRAIEGLAYPEQGEASSRRVGNVTEGSLEEMIQLSQTYSAIELFRQHAHRVDQHFSLSAREAPYVMRICQLVEGLPLGVELAAAWTAARSSRDIAREIERNLDILSTDLRNVPRRQRSIRATFQHSWQLLSQEEKDLLARLSIFSGGFCREAALQVTDASPSALLALIDKSLVRRIAPDRYDMHGLLAQYAADKLRDSPQQRENTEMQHARYFAAFLERQSEHLRRARGKDDFHELALEIENAHQAWRLAVARDRTSLVEQSLESLYLFYDFQCRFQEGIELFSRAIERWTDDSGPGHLLGRLLSRQGALYLQLCQYRRARAALERSQLLLESLDMTAEQIFCLVNLARVARRQGDYEETVRLSTRSLALSRQTADSWGITHSLLQLGMVQYRTGDVDGAQALLEESLAVAQETDNPRLVIAPLNLLGDIACHRGDYAAGQSLFERCLALTRELGDQFRVAVVLNNLGTVFHVLEKLEEAQSAYQESLDICREIGDQEGQAIALSNLGEVAYAAGAYADAERLYRQGLAIGRDIRDQWTVMACLNNLGEVAYALQEDDTAKQYFAEALTIAHQTHTLPLVLKVLVNLAALFAQEGKTEHAAKLLELGRQHPASEQVTREKAERLLDQIVSLPAPAPPGMAKRSLDSVVTDVLVLLARSSDALAPS
jgi:predicted ATPase/Tfp pilus assembly protein PilF